MEESDIIVVASALLESGIGARPVICHSAAWAAIYLYFPIAPVVDLFSPPFFVLCLSQISLLPPIPAMVFLPSQLWSSSHPSYGLPPIPAMVFLPSQLWSSSHPSYGLPPIPAMVFLDFCNLLVYIMSHIFSAICRLTIVSSPFHPVSNPELQHTGYSPYPVMFAYLQSTLIFCCCCCCCCCCRCCCCSDRATISIPYILTGMHYVYARIQNLTAFWKYSYPPLLPLPRSTHSLLLVFRGALPHLLVLSRQIRIFPPRYTTFVTSLIHFPSNQMNSSPICFATHVTSVFSIGSSSVHTSHILPLLQ